MKLLVCVILVFGLSVTGIFAQDIQKNSKRVDFDNNLYEKKFNPNDFAQVFVGTIVVIDDKIYKIDSKEFKALDKQKIVSLEIINDERSPTGIYKVIIIKTKKENKNE